MHYADLPSDIPTDEEILALLDKLNSETVALIINPQWLRQMRLLI